MNYIATHLFLKMSISVLSLLSLFQWEVLWLSYVFVGLAIIQQIIFFLPNSLGMNLLNRKTYSKFKIADKTNLPQEKINQLKNYIENIKAKYNYDNFPDILIDTGASGYHIPSNTIVLNTKLFQKDYMWKSVLAHETAHYWHHQNLNKSSESLMKLNHILITFAGIFYGSPLLAITSSFVLGFISFATTFYESRKNEYEADLFSNAVTRGKMLRLLKTMKEPQKVSFLLWRTHPTLKQRIKYLETNKFTKKPSLVYFDDIMHQYIFQMSDVMEAVIANK